MKRWLQNFWRKFCEICRKIFTSKMLWVWIIVPIVLIVGIVGGMHLFKKQGGVSNDSSSNSVEKEKIEITKVEFVYAENVVNECQLSLYATNVPFTLKINDKNAADIDADFSVRWYFVGEAYDAKFSNDAKNTEGISAVVNELGYVLGTIRLGVAVTSSNTIDSILPIQIVEAEGFSFDAISAMSVAEGDNTYIEGQMFEKDSIMVWGHYGEYKPVRILDYTVGQAPLTATETEINITYKDNQFEYPIFVEPKKLQSLEIIAAPDQVEYIAGQCFNTMGLKLQANYEYLSEIVEDFAVDTERMLLEGERSVLISYTHKDVTKTVEQPINVLPRKLLSMTMDVAGVQKQYTEGDSFDPEGLIVKAEFEYFGILEVDGYTYDSAPLQLTSQTVEISYTVGAVTLRQDIEISVRKPYGHIGEMTVLTPADVSISWAYPYQTEEGEWRLDNTTYKENDLIYDKVNGSYEVPVGATVTVSLRNPAIVSLAVNGIEQKIDLVEKTFSWKVRSSESMSISSIEMTANHSVIRFMGDEKEQSFLYEGFWDGVIAQEDINRLAAVFADTDIYYYTYFVNGKTLRIEDIDGTAFAKNALITVAKNVRSENAKNILLNIDSDIKYAIRIPNADVETWNIPVFTRAGYHYEGWALSENGEVLTEDMLAEVLASEAEEVQLYIRWVEEQIDYSQMYIRQIEGEGQIVEVTGTSSAQDIAFAGMWTASLTEETETVQCTITFREDGTFVYEVVYNDEAHCSYMGKYRLSGNSIVVIYSEPVGDEPYLNGVDFGFTLVGDQIGANVIMLLGQNVVLMDCKLGKTAI